jgi:hypothetical protein
MCISSWNVRFLIRFGWRLADNLGMGNMWSRDKVTDCFKDFYSNVSFKALKVLPILVYGDYGWLKFLYI